MSQAIAPAGALNPAHFCPFRPQIGTNGDGAVAAGTLAELWLKKGEGRAGARPLRKGGVRREEMNPLSLTSIKIAG